MRSAGNFHPEWGYLAPTPSFVRTLRIVLVATAVGATAGAGVVVSMLPHHASGANSIAAHALVTSVPAADSTAAIAPAQPAAAVASQPQTAAVSAQPGAPSPQPAAQPGEIGAAGTNTANSASAPQSISAPNAANGAASTHVAAHVEEPAVASPGHDEIAPVSEAAPSKKSKRHRASYEAIRRWQAARGEAKKPRHGDGGFEPLFRLFSSRTSPPYSAN
jgi:hypothetical protein